jgi:hypothetical protein
MLLAKAYDDYIKIVELNSLKTIALLLIMFGMLLAIVLIMRNSVGKKSFNNAVTPYEESTVLLSLVISLLIFIFGVVLIAFICNTYGGYIIAVSPTAKYEDVDKYFKIKTRCMDGTYTADKIKQYDEIKEEED